MDSKITVLVSSCDKYEEAWAPFFKLFSKYWQDFPYSFVLSTETKQFICDYLSVKTVNSNVSSWGKRLKVTIEQIESEYILFFLDDFFIREKVDTDIFNQAVRLLDENKKIGAVKFYSYPNCTDGLIKGDVEGFELFSYLDNNIKNSRDVEATLWRKECFLKMIFENDTPWTFELDNNYRAMFVGYDFVCQNTKKKVAFNYCIKPKFNLGISQGKWLCDTPEFLRQNGINNIDYDNLGVLPRFENRDEYELYMKQETNLKHSSIPQKHTFDIKEILYNIKKRALRIPKNSKHHKRKKEKEKIEFYRNYFKNIV